MIDQGETKFLWIDTVMKKFLFLAMALVLIDYSFFAKSELNEKMVYVYVFKLLSIILVGFLEAKLDWKFYQRIFGPKVNTLEDLRRRDLINNGVLTFGLPLGIINFKVFNSNFTFEYVRLSIWLITGVGFGIILWMKNKEAFKQMLNE
jgi:hypothetical protein